VRVEDFSYDLPPGQIAQSPSRPRDSARLMVVRRARGTVEHGRFRDLPSLLAPGDLLVANDTQVIPARLRGRKLATGGAVEALLLRPLPPPGGARWLALVRGRVALGTRLAFTDPDGAELVAEVAALDSDGSRELAFERDPLPVLGCFGQLPLPPYIHQELPDPNDYQTIYARVAGSVAAPTAGLHFTERLIARLAEAGVGLAFVTLHVGADTFRPMADGDVEGHVMHSEWAEVPPQTMRRVIEARATGHRVVAVGTTSVRALETAAARPGGAGARPWSGWTDLYIRPGHRFLAVDALVTNFHLPRTTLLVLVAAFAGKDLLDRAYAEAIAGQYRFYSFGDAMLVL
jgi:S-adenosylmethionine:tRNA ribosyltransferase-isomerase